MFLLSEFFLLVHLYLTVLLFTCIYYIYVYKIYLCVCVCVCVCVQIVKKERKSYIINISKEYSIVSQFTSFVAIEEREKVHIHTCIYVYVQ